jgi:cytochrome c oxidase assembly factor 5
MPRYYEDKPEGGACAGVKEDLGACLLQSDCVLQVARLSAPGDDQGNNSVAGLREGLPVGLWWRSCPRRRLQLQLLNWADSLSSRSLSFPPRSVGDNYTRFVRSL